MMEPPRAAARGATRPASGFRTEETPSPSRSRDGRVEGGGHKGKEWAQQIYCVPGRSSHSAHSRDRVRLRRADARMTASRRRARAPTGLGVENPPSLQRPCQPRLAPWLLAAKPFRADLVLIAPREPLAPGQPHLVTRQPPGPASYQHAPAPSPSPSPSPPVFVLRPPPRLAACSLVNSRQHGSRTPGCLGDADPPRPVSHRCCHAVAFGARPVRRRGQDAQGRPPECGKSLWNVEWYVVTAGGALAGGVPS